MVTQTSGSYSHSNKNISFPRAALINYAFLLQDLYFIRQELECMLNFLLSTRAASPPQLLPRQLIEKCFVALRIWIHSYLCTHNTHTHTLVMVLCSCLCVSVCACMHVFAPCVINYSQTQPAMLCCFSFNLIYTGITFFLPYYCESEVKDYI